MATERDGLTHAGSVRHRSNDVISGVTHVAGGAASIALLVLLVVLAAQKGTAWHIVGYSTFCVGMFLLYAASAFYHLIPSTFPRLKQFAQTLDHSMIFVLIAATYTPIAFLALPPAWRWAIFGVIWGLAVLGVVLKFAWKAPRGGFFVFLYAIMGWLVLIAYQPLLAGMDALSTLLLLLGGIAYTIGIVFFALEKRLRARKYFWMHEIFHVLVLLGSALHSLVMFRLIP